MKKILVIYYSQTGQLQRILDSLLRPLTVGPTFSVEYLELEPAAAYPFPWTRSEFLEVFPESVLEKPIGLKPWAAKHPGEYDLVILAFGMNDSAGRPAEEYQANIRSMMDAVRSARPDTDFILLATMLGNRDWVALHQELFPQYRDKLAALCGPGCALADMTSVWEELLRRKNDWDLTGNGVNHPNDFGHRIYAQVLSALLIAR